PVPVQQDEPQVHHVSPWRDPRNLMISMLAAFRVGALGNHGGRSQNGTASTGKLTYSNVRYGKASNRVLGGHPCKSASVPWTLTWVHHGILKHCASRRDECSAFHDR